MKKVVSPKLKHGINKVPAVMEICCLRASACFLEGFLLSLVLLYGHPGQTFNSTNMTFVPKTNKQTKSIHAPGCRHQVLNLSTFFERLAEVCIFSAKLTSRNYKCLKQSYIIYTTSCASLTQVA